MSNKTIYLDFKKEDFFETDYLNYQDCAITRAFKRAGFPNYVDVGDGIVDKEKLIEGEYIVSNKNSTYDYLVLKVSGMYSVAQNRPVVINNEIVEPIKPEDFTFALPID